MLRDFNSHDRWHDVVDDSRIEGDERSDQVGCVRSFTLKDGNRIREQLLTLVGHRVQEHLLHRRSDGAAAALRGDGDAEAGDRRQPHLLALGVDLRHAARAGARAARDGRRRGVYEAGFENLRRHLRAAAATGGARAARAAMPSALPMPTRQVVVAPLRRPRGAAAADGEAPAPGAGEVRIRQRAIGVNFLDVYLRRGWIPAMLPPARRAGHGGGRQRDRCRRAGVAASCPATASPTSARCPAPTAACARVPAEWVVRLPPAVEDDVAAALLLKGITADYLLRDLGQVRRRHAAAGARRGRRRRAAASALGAPRSARW